MPYTRPLKYRFPLVRGEDVIALQQRLELLGYADLGQIDGIFGLQTDQAVRRFQTTCGISIDGIVGPYTWRELFQESDQQSAPEKILRVIDELSAEHAYRNSIRWQLTPAGLSIAGAEPQGSGGEPKTVSRIWQSFGQAIEHSANMLEVPAELIVATICTESSGKVDATRMEPGYVSDEQTPHRVSYGLTQTLLSTAREALGDERIDRNWLLDPDNAIHAGAAYIAKQWRRTHYDPPKVACAYNAGSIVHDASESNRWHMRQYPIGTSHHADRFVAWFNDAMVVFSELQKPPRVSFQHLLNG